jgi:hypothetical protein
LPVCCKMNNMVFTVKNSCYCEKGDGDFLYKGQCKKSSWIPLPD